jgi:DNA-binding transcriptional LysR family regulator
MGASQSAVSHLLAKLRAITGDALFVKSGRGIAATPRALVLADRARDLLRDLERFAAPDAFDPARWKATFTIAANDFQRDSLLPQLVARLRRDAPGVALRVIPSNVPTLEMLREGAADLVISPRPPDGADVMQKRLFEDRYRVFYDASVRAAPATEADYLAAAHATVVYEPRRSIDLDARLAERGVQRRIILMTPGFSALPAFLFGSDLVATVPGLLRFGPMKGLANIAPPIPCPTLPMYMIWSRRRHDDPAHRWVRDEVEVCARRLAADVA